MRGKPFTVLVRGFAPGCTARSRMLYVSGVNQGIPVVHRFYRATGADATYDRRDVRLRQSHD